MFEAYGRSECGVPSAFYVNDVSRGEAVTGVCADLRGVSAASTAITFAACVLIAAALWRVPRPGGADNAQAPGEPVAAARFEVADTAADVAELEDDAQRDGVAPAAVQSARHARARPRDVVSTQAAVPMLWALLALVLGFLVFASSRSVALARFEVQRAAFEASDMTKNDFVQMDAMDRRAGLAARSALASSSIVTFGGVAGRLVVQ